MKSVFTGQSLKYSLSMAFLFVTFIVAFVSVQILSYTEKTRIETLEKATLTKMSKLVNLLIIDDLVENDRGIQHSLMLQINASVPEMVAIEVLNRENEMVFNWYGRGEPCPTCKVTFEDMLLEKELVQMRLYWDIQLKSLEGGAEQRSLFAIVFLSCFLLSFLLYFLTSWKVLTPFEVLYHYFSSLLEHKKLPTWGESTKFWSTELQDLKKMIFKFETIQTELLEQQIKSKIVIENSINGVLLLDQEGSIIDHNPAAIDLLNSDKSTLRGMAFRDVLMDDATVGQAQDKLCGLPLGGVAKYSYSDRTGHSIILELLVKSAVTAIGCLYIVYFRRHSTATTGGIEASLETPYTKRLDRIVQSFNQRMADKSLRETGRTQTDEQLFSDIIKERLAKMS